MKPSRMMRAEVVAIAVIAAVAAVGVGHRQVAPAALQLAQEEYGAPIGEDDGPIGGATVYGYDVGSAPIGGAMVGGAPAGYGDGAIGGAMVGGAPAGYGDGAIDGAAVGGEAVGQGGDDAPIGGDTLY